MLEGGQAQGLLIDITNESSVISGFENITSVDPRIDIMINSAGVVGPTGIKTGDVESDLFRHTLDVNLNGAFLMTKHAIMAMTPNNYRRDSLL